MKQVKLARGIPFSSVDTTKTLDGAEMPIEFLIIEMQLYLVPGYKLEISSGNSESSSLICSIRFSEITSSHLTSMILE